MYPCLDGLKAPLCKYSVATTIGWIGDILTDNWSDDKGIVNLTAAILLFPNDTVLFNNRAWEYVKYGEYDRAITDWTRAIQLSPRNKWYLGARGDIYVQKNDHDKAIADYTEIIRIDPNDWDAFEKRGAAYEAMGQHDKAVSDREKAVQLKKQKFDQRDPVLSIVSKCDWYMTITQGHLWQELDERIPKTREQPEKLAKVYLEESLRSFLDNDEREGEGFLEKALAVYSSMDQAEAERSRSAVLADFISDIFKGLNFFDEIIAECTETLKKYPEKSGISLNNRGNVYRINARDYKIIAGRLGVMGAEPETVARFQDSASYYYERAAADYTSAIQSNSLMPGKLGSVYHNRGNLYTCWGSYDKAIADYNEAIRLDSGDSGLYYNRGIVYDILGNYDQAVADYGEAIRLESAKSPQSGYFYNRGIVYDEKGEYEKAIADYTSAIHLATSIFTSDIASDALYNRSLAYKALSQHDKAEADLFKLRSEFHQLIKYKEVVCRRGRLRSSGAWLLNA
jgi:tetratricopeptide (TPR) repeat protein